MCRIRKDKEAAFFLLSHRQFGVGTHALAAPRYNQSWNLGLLAKGINRGKLNEVWGVPERKRHTNDMLTTMETNHESAMQTNSETSLRSWLEVGLKIIRQNWIKSIGAITSWSYCLSCAPCRSAPLRHPLRPRQERELWPTRSQPKHFQSLDVKLKTYYTQNWMNWNKNQYRLLFLFHRLNATLLATMRNEQLVRTRVQTIRWRASVWPLKNSR